MNFRKTWLYVFLVCCCASYTMSSFAIGGKLSALWSYCVFNSIEKGPFIETYLNVRGTSVKYVKLANGSYQGKITIAIRFEKDGVVSFQDKYNLLSPEVKDTLGKLFNFIDQQRILLAEGNYSYFLSIHDPAVALEAGEKPFESSGTVEIRFPKDSVCMSDIEMLESYKATTTTTGLTKSGYDMVPMVDNYYPAEIKSLKYYVELYNADKVFGNEPFALSTRLISLSNNQIINSLSKIQKQEPKSAKGVLSEVNIESLPSGNYKLEVSVLDRNNKVKAGQAVVFQRNNNGMRTSIRDSLGIFPMAYAIKNGDTLASYIRCLRPVSNSQEKKQANNVISSGNIELMQKYMSDFWSQKDSSGPEQWWSAYFVQMQTANIQYKTQINQGCETERGRVFLEYGRPDAISENKNEPSTYPYEIWHYYKLKSQTNRKFIFYCPEASTNDYVLLHSDAKGEIYDSQWEMKLNKRITPNRNYDDEHPQDHFGGKAGDNYRNPR